MHASPSSVACSRRYATADTGVYVGYAPARTVKPEEMFARNTLDLG